MINISKKMLESITYGKKFCKLLIMDKDCFYELSQNKTRKVKLPIELEVFVEQVARLSMYYGLRPASLKVGNMAKPPMFSPM